jgi:hypothetical protein
MGEVNPTFGKLFVPATVENAMLDLLRTWLPIYLAEVERQNDIEPCTIARPRSFATSVENDLEPAEQLPAIIAIAPGTVQAPEREAEDWRAWYQLTIVALVMTPEEVSTRTLAGYYAAAIRGAVLQHPSLDGTVEGVWWDGEEFQGEPGGDRNRTRGAALVHFRVKVPNIVSTATGPIDAEVVADPCDDYPPITTVQTVDIVVTENDT